MKVLIIGCGAVGIATASALCNSDVETDLVARGTTAQSIRNNGIERYGLFGHVVVPANRLRVFNSVEEAGAGYDFVIISAKTTGNADIATGIAKRKTDILNSNGLIMLFQNGYGNEQVFKGIFDLQRIYHVSFAIGFQRPQPNISEVTVFSKPVSIGSIFGALAEAAANLADAIKNGGIPCEVTNEIGKTLWAKLLYNCALNPLSAILRVNYGGLAKSDSSIAIISNIIDEIFTVMHAAGCETFWKDSESYKKEFFEKILPPTYEHRSSTLQDIERKIPTEIDSLNGAVVRIGSEYHIETPYNKIIVQMIKSVESLYNL
jgi:2-dehydropantoate 2-reductase